MKKRTTRLGDARMQIHAFKQKRACPMAVRKF
jgi:hypothetical protein